MTDLPDELRERLQDTDRIRNRVREQREVGNDTETVGDDIAGSRSPDGYYRYELVNLKGDGVELADDITTPPETSLKWNNAHDQVVDHKAEDVVGRVVDHKAEDVAGMVVDHKAEDFAGDLDTSQPEIDQIANLAEGSDPVGDALVPHEGGVDQFQAMPELDAGIGAVSELGFDDTELDLGDGM